MHACENGQNNFPYYYTTHLIVKHVKRERERKRWSYQVILPTVISFILYKMENATAHNPNTTVPNDILTFC